jgi:two-component system chemotaxis sensor kinase CheA
MTVRIEHLDKLLNLAGEVIITSSTLHDLQREMVDAVTYRRPIVESSIQAIKAADEGTRRISQDLHDLVMAIRMVEIGETFRLFRRSVRDLSRSLKKEINLKIEGEHVQIDKALAERLVEPLLHLIRNAADHGIEQPLERSRLGKPPEGMIRLEAIEHENETEILVIDDGRGIDENVIREKAKRCGLASSGDHGPGAFHSLSWRTGGPVRFAGIARWGNFRIAQTEHRSRCRHRRQKRSYRGHRHGISLTAKACQRPPGNRYVR